MCFSGSQLELISSNAVKIPGQQQHRQHTLYALHTIPGCAFTFLPLLCRDCHLDRFIYTETCPPSQTRQLCCTRRALTQSEHCRFYSVLLLKVNTIHILLFIRYKNFPGTNFLKCQILLSFYTRGVFSPASAMSLPYVDLRTVLMQIPVLKFRGAPVIWFFQCKLWWSCGFQLCLYGSYWLQHSKSWSWWCVAVIRTDKSAGSTKDGSYLLCLQLFADN